MSIYKYFEINDGLIMIKYKTNAEKCIELNAKAYKRRPVYKSARQVKKELKAMASMIGNSYILKDIDFRML